MVRLSEWVAYYRTHPNQLFLLDGIGALVSAAFLSLLVYFHEWVGLSPQVLIYLVLGVVLLSVYSLTCSRFAGKRWRLFLCILMAGNLLYSSVVIVLLMRYHQELTVYGYLYFIGEKLIVLSLVWFEYRVWRS